MVEKIILNEEEIESFWRGDECNDGLICSVFTISTYKVKPTEDKDVQEYARTFYEAYLNRNDF